MSEQWIKTLSNSETEQLIRVLSYLPMKKYIHSLKNHQLLKGKIKNMSNNFLKNSLL